MVLKTDRGYFCDAWENYDDAENFNFTDDIEEAYQFVGGLTPSWGNAPKYLRNDIKNKPINNLKQMHEYFGGEILTITKTEITKITFQIEKYM